MEIPLSPGKLRMNPAGLMSGVSFSLWVRAKVNPFGNVSPDPEADQCTGCLFSWTPRKQARHSHPGMIAQPGCLGPSPRIGQH